VRCLDPEGRVQLIGGGTSGAVSERYGSSENQHLTSSSRLTHTPTPPPVAPHRRWRAGWSRRVVGVWVGASPDPVLWDDLRPPAEQRCSCSDGGVDRDLVQDLRQCFGLTVLRSSESPTVALVHGFTQGPSGWDLALCHSADGFICPVSLPRLWKTKERQL
jgi:hypothetical protein